MIQRIAILAACASCALFSTGAIPAQSDGVARVQKLEDWRRCTEFGRVMRSKDKEKQRPYYDALLDAAHTFGVVAADYTFITQKKLRIGMTACGVLASLGRPTTKNRTVSASGHRDQLVYDSPRRLYVYLTDDVVTAWQE